MKSKRIALTAAALALLTLAHGGYAADAEKTGSVSGKINGPDGKPAAGATVKLVPDGQIKTAADEKPAKKKKKAAGLTATTAEDGTFKFENVPAASYRISATLSEVGSVRSHVSVTAGRDFPITLQLKRKL